MMSLRTGAWDELHLAGSPTFRNGEIVSIPLYVVQEIEGKETVRRSELGYSDRFSRYGDRKIQRKTSVAVLPAHIFDDWGQDHLLKVADAGLDWPVWWLEPLTDAAEVLFTEQDEEDIEVKEETI